MLESLTLRETLQMRRQHIGKSCKLHYEVAPLKIVQASKQYMYDDVGNEYLDCINNVSHVGHCHPHVVGAGQDQMAKLNTTQGFLSENLSLYAKRITDTMPESLCVCYLLNSGSEANDLALRLAKTYTRSNEVIVFDHAYHGNLGNLLEISPLKFKKMPGTKKEHVHVVSCPDTYKGKYREDTVNPAAAYAKEVFDVIQGLRTKGKQVGAFMSEPLMSQGGVIKPPPNYLKYVYRYVREAGGVCIADEVQVGLGRTGEYWSFMTQDVVPDIVTCGKPLGNGYPMAVVVTTREIADCLGDFASSFGGNPVACTIGLAVLDVITNEKLLSSAKSVGKMLTEGFTNIKSSHPMIGDVRGQGLVVGVELVTDKESRKPATEAAELLTYKMKQEKILMANEGPNKNVIILTPPMCFTCDNARRVIQTFGRILSEIESGACPDQVNEGQRVIEPTELIIPMDVIGGIGHDDTDDCHSNAKRARYEDLD